MITCLGGEGGQEALVAVLVPRVLNVSLRGQNGEDKCSDFQEVLSCMPQCELLGDTRGDVSRKQVEGGFWSLGERWARNVGSGCSW